MSKGESWGGSLHNSYEPNMAPPKITRIITTKHTVRVELKRKNPVSLGETHWTECVHHVSKGLQWGGGRVGSPHKSYAPKNGTPPKNNEKKRAICIGLKRKSPVQLGEIHETECVYHYV